MTESMQPVVSWYNETNNEEIKSWDLGVVDAGYVSEETTFLIWNNRGNLDYPVSKMENCSVTTKDSGGGNQGELVENKWIETRIDSMGEENEDDFVKIGGEDVKAIEARGSTIVVEDGENVEYTPGQGEILGVVNNGTLDDKANYVKATFRADVPADASAGKVNFLLRVGYQYT